MILGNVSGTSGPWVVQVRAIRERLGLTQEQLAHQLGVTVSTVNRWENNRAVPTNVTRKALLAL